MKVTLQMIADQVGVTCATVSLALRNDPQISEARRTEIQKTAETLGYRPNALVSSLMSHIRQAKPLPQRTGLLYLVSGERSGATPWASHTFDSYFRGASEQAARRGFHLEPFGIRDPGLSEARIDKILRARGIPGVIIGPNETPSLPFPRLPWSRLAAVLIGYGFSELPLDRVLANFYKATLMAMAFLKHEQCAPVRLILPELHDRNVLHLWKAAYLQQRLGQERRFLAPIVVGAPGPAVKWVKENPDCTVLGTNLVRQWLHDAGLREHIHFRFVSLNVEGIAGMTGVCEPSRDVGAEAADRVISLIHLNSQGMPVKPHITLIEPDWQQGQWMPVTDKREATQGRRR